MSARDTYPPPMYKTALPDPDTDEEIFRATPPIRWIVRRGLRVLQQEWRGSKGTLRWQDVPEE